MTITIKKAGIQTSIQDLGRHKFGNIGVQVSGAMDKFSLQIANVLVGNNPGTPGLEITINGPILEFKSHAIIAIVGASFNLTLNDQVLPTCRPILVYAGGTLSFGTRKKGARAYLSIRGGFDVPMVLGSRSTNLLEGFGGYDGRALKAGDELHAMIQQSPELKKINKKNKDFYAPSWHVRDVVSYRVRSPGVIRFIPTAFWNDLPSKEKDIFTKIKYKVATGSNRMAYRLEGGALRGGSGHELSRPTTFGTIQLPPEGNPIVLMADCQTVGGDSVLGGVITFDHLLLAQLAPGDQLCFKAVNLDIAHDLLLCQNRDLRELGKTVKNRKFWDEKNY